MVNISKSFGEVAALREENFEVGYNEVIGLIGDNGAGKSIQGGVDYFRRAHYGFIAFRDKKVLNFVKRIKAQGKSWFFITHNIYHVYPAADRFIVLDRGRTVGEFIKKDISLEELVDKLYLFVRVRSSYDESKGKSY